VGVWAETMNQPEDVAEVVPLPTRRGWFTLTWTGQPPAVPMGEIPRTIRPLARCAHFPPLPTVGDHEMDTTWPSAFLATS
jgi:hypothetical protein